MADESERDRAPDRFASIRWYSPRWSCGGSGRRWRGRRGRCAAGGRRAEVYLNELGDDWQQAWEVTEALLGQVQARPTQRACRCWWCSRLRVADVRRPLAEAGGDTGRRPAAVQPDRSATAADGDRGAARHPLSTCARRSAPRWRLGTTDLPSRRPLDGARARGCGARGGRRRAVHSGWLARLRATRALNVRRAEIVDVCAAVSRAAEARGDRSFRTCLCGRPVTDDAGIRRRWTTGRATLKGGQRSAWIRRS